MNNLSIEALPQPDKEAITYSTLPPVLFHATTKDRVASILERGLKPSRSMPVLEKTPIVCMSDTILFAKFCASDQQETLPDDLVIFAVATEDLDKSTVVSYLDKDNPYKSGEKMHEVQSTAPIPLDSIRLLSPDEVKQIEIQER